MENLSFWCFEFSIRIKISLALILYKLNCLEVFYIQIYLMGTVVTFISKYEESYEGNF